MASSWFDASLPPELESSVRSELTKDERLIWAGQPLPGRFARGAIAIVLFGIPWTAFAIFWVAAASGIVFGGDRPQANGGLGNLFACFPLFGVPFVLVGVGMLSSPYWMRRQAQKTCYALTDRRVILWQASVFGSVTVRSYLPDALGRMTRTEHSDGSGDLIFEEQIRTGYNSNGDRTTSSTRHGFLAIANVREVESLVRTTLL